MIFSTIAPALLVWGLGVFAAPTADLSTLSTPSKHSLQWAGPASPLPQLKPAFTATIDWDLDNVAAWILTNKNAPLVIYYVVKLDDGYWAYVKHTGGAILRKTQNGVV
ncbi:hypothetical protein SLS57_012258 [Botryosphaeria dothidea]